MYNVWKDASTLFCSEDSKEGLLKLAEALLRLGEVGLETGNCYYYCFFLVKSQMWRLVNLTVELVIS